MKNRTPFFALLASLALLISLPAIAQQPKRMPPPFNAPPVAAAPERERVSFNNDWLFMRGDTPRAGSSLDYERVKQWILSPAAASSADVGADLSYPRNNYDDSAWRKLDLPHDWGIEGPFRQDLPGDTGKLPWAGTGWYRKHFDSPASDAGRRVYLELDGAMACAMVWLNGHFVGGWPYGYTSWRVDLTPFLKTGAENILAVRLDNPAESSRWYPGSGIYRNVWLVKTAPVAIAQWGVFVSTPEVSRESALVNIAVTLDNKSAARAEVKVGARLFAADAGGRATGEPVATIEPRAMRLWPERQAKTTFVAKLAAPRLWSLAERNRYVAEVTVTNGEGEYVDGTATPFGVRKIETFADRGFFLNGEHVPIRGVCLHHDLGALGAAFNLRAAERQLEILQSMGCNAIRTSHNPPAPELLDLCDRMGFLVMDETFDCWAMGKKHDDYSRLYPDWNEKDVRAMVRRDRNHPCVVFWSVGNEVREQNEVDGWKTAAHLAGVVREEDRTRPVTAGLNNFLAGFSGFETVFDVFGYNYKPRQYAQFRAERPQVSVIGSETVSAVSSRGEYFFPVSATAPGARDLRDAGRADFQVSSYDLTIPADEWRGQEENPGVLGEFVWTGFDYLGEPTPYNMDVPFMLNFTDPAERARAQQELDERGKIAVPSRSSYFGIIDLAGFPKDRFFAYQAHWRPDFPMAHILPHWTWPERAGEITPVYVYTSGDEAELFLNGQSLGRKKLAPFEYCFHWDDVKYTPGELKVVTWKNGKPWAESVMRTAGPAAKLLLAPDRETIRADGKDLSFVTVTIADKDGTLAPRSKNEIKFGIISGEGEIVAVDNGDATSFEPFQASERKAYNGLALVIVRAKPGQTGAITLRAESDQLAPAEVTLRSE